MRRWTTADNLAFITDYLKTSSKRSFWDNFPRFNTATPPAANYANRRFYGGYDPAKINDRSAYCQLEKLDDGVLETRMLLNLQGMDYKRQVPEVIRIGKQYGIIRLEIDATGHEQLYEELRDGLGHGRVGKVTFSKQTKEDLILELRLACMDKKLRLSRKLRFYEHLRREMHDLDPDKLDHPKGGSSDLVWSLALAVHASRTNFIEAKRIILPFMDR